MYHLMTGARGDLVHAWYFDLHTERKARISSWISAGPQMDEEVAVLRQLLDTRAPRLLQAGSERAAQAHRRDELGHARLRLQAAAILRDDRAHVGAAAAHGGAAARARVDLVLVRRAHLVDQCFSFDRFLHVHAANLVIAGQSINNRDTYYR